jgi:DNA-binding MurR/RpiR family transcriptional regulator
MAFDNFGERAGAPGDIRDRIAGTGPEDVVISMTFPHYSVETIAAHELACRRGARTIAVTDGPHSPIAQGADIVLCPQMHGPQHLPSMVAYFAMAEALVAAMVAQSDAAQGNIARFEQRLLESGAYRR